MPVKIRLMRIGTKKRPFYRVVAVDERKKRTGAYIELLGTYNPLTEPKQVNLKQDRIDEWVKNGAQMTEGFLRIIGKAPQRPARKPKKQQKEAPAAAPAATPSAEEPAAEAPAAEETPSEPEEVSADAPVENENTIKETSEPVEPAQEAAETLAPEAVEEEPQETPVEETTTPEEALEKEAKASEETEEK